jgi:transcriptional regulator with XRE-family HTH domain
MNLIRKIRKEHRLTQGDFGHLFGVTGSHISKIEKGQSYPHDELLDQIAEYFSISQDELKKSIYTRTAIDEQTTLSYKLRYEVSCTERKRLQEELRQLREQNDALEERLKTFREAQPGINLVPKDIIKES